MKTILYVFLVMTLLMMGMWVLPMYADKLRKRFESIGLFTAALNARRKRVIALILCAAMLGTYIPAMDAAKADAIQNPSVLNGEAVVNGTVQMQLGEVTYSEMKEDADNGEEASSAWVLNETTAVLRAGKNDTISFSGVISAPEGETISWVRVDVYDAASQEPYTVGEEYFYVMNLNQEQYDLSNIPALKITETFGTSDFVLEEGKQYIIMLQAADSNGNLLEDMDAVMDGDQGPAILLTVKLSPENCTHPHAEYRYILHDSGETRVYCYGDSLVHQIEPLYERYCGLCDRYLMNIWGQGTPEEHSMVDGVCSVCGYVDGSEVYTELPEIQSISSSAGEVFTAGTEVTFSAVALANAGLAEISLYVDDELRLAEVAEGTIGSLKCTISDLAIGEHTVKATVADADGWYNEASYTVMVLQADFATCAHVNTSVQQTTQFVADENGEMQPITVDVVHCLDCATDLYTNEPVMTLDDNAADYVYTAKDGKATITEYVGTETNVVVPETINGYTVAVIDEFAFYYTSAVSVTLPSTVETINEWAFGGDDLTEIHVNKNAFVHEGAFRGCYGPTVVYGYTGSTAEIAAEAAELEFVSVGTLAAAPTLTVEPDTVAYGEEYAWSVSHPDTNTIWIQRSFEDEYGNMMYANPLTEYEAGEYTRTADRYSENYTEVITAKVLIDGDWSAIAQARVKVVFETGVSGEYEYTVVDGTAQITGYLGTDTDVIIPSEVDGYTVTSIGDAAFYGADLVSVTFPSTLETIGGAVFFNCANLESIYTNKKLLVEYASSFQDCEGVTVYGYSGGSVEAAAREAGCNFVSLGTLSSVVPTLTITPTTVAYGDYYEMTCELEGADLFHISGSFVSASESYTYSMLEEAENGRISYEYGTDYLDVPISYTETYRVSARVNGEWTQYCVPQTVTVVYGDELILSTPQIHKITSPVPAHKELTISWDPVENAQEYEVWLHSVYGGYYELATSTPESISRTMTVEEISSQYFPIGSDRENIDIDVEVTAKAQGYSSATSTANFTMSIYQFGKPVLRGVPEQVMQEDGFEVTWEAVEYADEIDSDVYYEFLLLDEQGNETHLSGAWGDGANDLSCWLWFGSYYAPVPGDYTLRVLVSTYDVPIRESYSDYPIKVIAPFEYEIVDGEAIITGYNGSEAYLTIPDTINGYPVAKIGDSAFEGNTTITEVYLPDSVTEIGARAFKNCTALESIYGPGVTSIGEEAFYGCVNLINVQFYEYIYYIGGNAFYGVDLPDYTQPLTVYIKDTDAVSFEGNDVIGKVVYPEGVTEIPARTHYANTKLAEVYLPTTLETIGSQAFAACGELNYVKLYDGITSIADDAFADSPNTVLYIYVQDMETVSYVEQYAIDHEIPYKKILYSTEGAVSPTISVDSQVGGGVIDVQGNEVWVKVNEEIILGAAGNSAEVAHFYLNDEIVGEYEFENAIVEVPYTFTEPGDVTFYAKTYSGTELIETSQTLLIHVVGITLEVDNETPWTCENVHFNLAVSNVSGVASIYADDVHLLDVQIADGKAEWDYAFRKAGERTIKVLIDGLDPLEKSITVRYIDKLAVPVITAEATQPLEAGMAISWDAIEHADGYVVRAINTAGDVFFEQELEASDTQTISYNIAAENLQGAGTYAVFVMAYGYQYDQSESEAVNIAMVEEGSVFFTVNKTQVTTGESVTFTVYASGATAAELIVDGESIEIYDMSGDMLSIERPFSKAGDREVTFRALVDGVWTECCDIQVIQVTSMGQLAKPEPTTEQYHRLGNEVEVTWAAIDHADGYIIRVYDAGGIKVYENEIKVTAETEVSETIPSETFVSCTVYSIDVIAYGAGYDQNEGGTTTEMLERLPGPEIVTPKNGEALEARSCELTWKAVEGAQSYVVSLARKTVDENGETVYEKVWASPNEVVNVGDVLSHPLDELEYGAEYRVAVGAVLEGTGLEDATEVGWTERMFSVAMPELGVTMTVSPETANEKQNVTITVAVANASVSAILKKGTDEIVPSRNEETQAGREFDFIVTEQKQGTYTYTVIVEGTGEFAGIRNEKAVTVTYLDANAAVIHEITADPATCWPETDVAFEINANAMTEQVKIRLQQDEKLITEYDLLLGDVNTHVFNWTYCFMAADTYTIRVTPINEDNESGAAHELSYTVLERGKLPSPIITSPKNGMIETDESVTVTWDAVVLSPEMAFGGYCILLEKQNEKGEYAAVPAYTYVNTNETSYTLTGLEPGSAYKLHLFTLEQGHTEPDGDLHGEAVVEFSYRTVPAFTLNSVIGGAKGEAITAEWTAPAWVGKNIVPDFYIVYWIGPDGTTIETQTVRNETKSTLTGNKVTQEGRYSVDVYACMYESWGEYPQAHAVVSGSYVIGKPEVIITHPNVEQNTYLITEDYIEVHGEVKGGVRQVLARILDRDGNPIDLIGYGDGSTVKHVVVQPDVNGKFYVKLNMKDFFDESDGDETKYCVQVLGFISPDAPVVEKHDCKAECWIDTDGSEISNLRVNGYSNYYWLFNDQSMKATVKTNALPQSVRFYVDGELKYTDAQGTDQDDAGRLFETKYFNISKEGYYEITASTYDGKKAGPVGVYVVTKTAEETVYYNNTLKALNVLSRPILGAENKISPIAAPCEMIKVGTYGSFTAVKVNGVTGFVLTRELTDQMLRITRPSAGDSVDIWDKQFEKMYIRWDRHPDADYYKIRVILHVTTNEKEQDVEIINEKLNVELVKDSDVPGFTWITKEQFLEALGEWHEEAMQNRWLMTIDVQAYVKDN